MADPIYTPDQERILKWARLRDTGAAMQGKTPYAQRQLYDQWGYEADLAAARRKSDQQMTEAGARAFAGGGTITPEQAAAAVRAGTPYDPAMLNPDQVALMKEQDRLRYAGRYGNISDQTGLFTATKPQLDVAPDNTVWDKNDPNNVNRRFIKVGEGQYVDQATGQVMTDPGYIAGQARLKGSTAAAEAEAQNSSRLRYAGPTAAAEAQGRATGELVEVFVPGRGKVLVPKSQVLGAGGWQSAPDAITAELDKNTLVGGQKTASEAAAQLPHLEQAISLSKTVDSGKSQNFFLPLRQFAHGMGLTVDPNLPEVEQFRSVVAYLTPRMRPEGSGSSSDFDALMYQASLPGFEKTPGGNQLIATAMYQTAKWQIAKAEAQRKYYDTEGRGSLTGFDVDKYVPPVFPKPKTAQDREALPPGTLYIAPDGTFNIKR